MANRIRELLQNWLVIILLIVAILLIISYGYSIPATGFGDYTSPAGDFSRSKTLWDWLELLIIPAVLAIVGAWINQQVRRSEQGRSDEQERESALQNYIDQMSELLLQGRLAQDEVSLDVRLIAKARTVNILRTLDSKRNSLVLRFLQEIREVHHAYLIDLKNADLTNANLEAVDFSHANLDGAILNAANLHSANLSNANLQGASLTNTNLSDASLEAANLEHASLIRTNLQRAALFSVNFQYAELYNADLREAHLERARLANADMYLTDLRGAHLLHTNLEQAFSKTALFDETTQMPDGEKWNPASAER